MKNERPLSVVEHVSGVYSYHLAHEGEHTALCGRTAMMRTGIPLDGWGTSSHLHEKWCVDCALCACGTRRESATRTGAGAIKCTE